MNARTSAMHPSAMHAPESHTPAPHTPALRSRVLRAWAGVAILSLLLVAGSVHAQKVPGGAASPSAQKRPSAAGAATAPKTASAEKTPSASTVLANVRARFARIADYTADITAVVDMPGVKVPPMKAVMYFKRPDKVRIKAEGFAMLPRDVVAFNPAMLSEDLYDAVVQGTGRVGAADCIMVKLLARSDTLRVQRLMLYVDPATWTIARMTSDPDKGTPADVALTYTLVENTHLLPSRMVLRMEPPADASVHNPMRKPGRTVQKGPATVTVSYENYRVNTGLSDALFKETRK